MFNNAKIGFQHNIPISTNFKIFKHFSVTAGSNFNEVWTFNTINKFFDIFVCTKPEINPDVVITPEFKPKNKPTILLSN